MIFGPQGCAVDRRENVERRVENPLTTFAVERIINRENSKSFMTFLFRSKHVNFEDLTFCFLGKFFWMPIMVNRYAILDTTLSCHLRWKGMTTHARQMFLPYLGEWLWDWTRKSIGYGFINRNLNTLSLNFKIRFSILTNVRLRRPMTGMWSNI